MTLSGKKIVLGVTGGIAAYKAISLTSKLTQSGAIVKVILTSGAQKFVTSLSFQAISRQPVYLDTFDELDAAEIQHIALADWADYVVVAPATANIIGKYANGIADDLLSTMLLAATSPVFFAPAMNVHMYEHAAVINNMDTLQQRGVTFIEPDEGYLACGYVGKGRLAEPEEIVHFLKEKSRQASLLQGKHVLITAGPTQEKIDPVRFLTNHSSGKMGYQLATVAAELGANVTLVSGPVQLETPGGVTRVDVVSAKEMYEVVTSRYDEADIVIKTAAVSDYTPKVTYDQKLKKQTKPLALDMVRTKDILKTLGDQKTNQYLVGFAAETEDVVAYGKEKLINKQLDMVVINDVSKPNQGFHADTNAVTIVTKTGQEHTLPLQTKRAVAKEILRIITEEVDQA
ncbi:phosphopantothenoylcysteine decarboxylase / phosphopantothenate--cysteine ligase [Halolactibacillus halophilus]|uniref:Coenzyme A biosynthesis bifunctional protein CoaBC n=1 Tax=Halolactibacillus halophilus TaxID=306540 RepID=A0A1I5LPX7_9BACI|nr:bifunctional phosphopantothenoylcysteine decarboxylase/phosphopantothenate--cysteine ligase CoaBC [Halolactibacillus halophilus]GEM00721.1 phosphopantothenoylcysteine decarboxylase [Halolactibacillus halophilus]SFO99213.1 phosphopantothenoylcysteine decarboxylase / phosphopantothenate--cysteine ligase [Halolactibacillus halophilus]